MLNKVTFIGNLTRDPELVTQSQKKMVKFGLAVNEGSGDKRRTLFIDVVSFDKTADFVEKYLTRGSQVVVDGSLSMNQWEKNGEKRTSFSVMGWTVQGLGKKSEGETESKQQAPAPQDSSSDDDDEDIPF